MDKNDQLFMQLLYMFHTSAMQGLGKIADPTGQMNRNLENASQTIDLMAMLKEKTKGNLPDRKSTRLNSSHKPISYAVFCLKKKTNIQTDILLSIRD